MVRPFRLVDDGFNVDVVYVQSKRCLLRRVSLAHHENLGVHVNPVWQEFLVPTCGLRQEPYGRLDLFDIALGAQEIRRQ